MGDAEVKRLVQQALDPLCLAMDVGQGTQDTGFRNDVLINFECRPSEPVVFVIRDEHGKPTTAALEIHARRVYGKILDESDADN